VRRFLIKDGEAEPGRMVRIHGEDHRYLTRVLRLRAGAELDATDAAGRACRLRIVEEGRNRCVARVMEMEIGGESEEAEVRLHLYQCLPKPARMDIIVRQAAEAGVYQVVPVVSRYVVAPPSDARVDRWRRISTEALQQCGRRSPMRLGEPCSVEQLAAEQPEGIAIFFYERPEGARPLHEILGEAASDICVVVGPEGGLAAEEVEMLRNAGFAQGYLGPTVLRVETAAISAIQTVRVIVRERQTWRK